MAVSIPSDLVLDVLKNADPARRDQAAAKLEAHGSGFAVAMKQEALEIPSMDGETSTPETAGRAEANQEFQRMVLRNLFETILPDAESGTYGTGTAAGIWRSFQADELARVSATSGGLGLAAVVTDEQPAHGISRAQGWPYFTTPEISGFIYAGASPSSPQGEG